MLIDGKRALAYTAVIDEIKPIEGYDCITGWWGKLLSFAY
jgi:hypothetical protein